MQLQAKSEIQKKDMRTKPLSHFKDQVFSAPSISLPSLIKENKEYFFVKTNSNIYKYLLFTFIRINQVKLGDISIINSRNCHQKM